MSCLQCYTDTLTVPFTRKCHYLRPPKHAYQRRLLVFSFRVSEMQIVPRLAYQPMSSGEHIKKTDVLSATDSMTEWQRNPPQAGRCSNAS